MSKFTPTIQKELRPAIKRLRKQGWTIEPTGSTHVLVRDPDGRAVTTLATSTCNRSAYKRALTALRRAGADV